MEAHHSIGLRPPPVVADRHTDDSLKGPPYTEPIRARLEVVALCVLEFAPRFVLGMARDVNLPELPYDRPVTLHEQEDVVAVLDTGSVCRKFGISEGEPDSESFGLIKQRLGVFIRHRPVIKVVEFRRILREPSWEERGQRQLGIDEQFDPLVRCLSQQLDETLDHLFLRFIAGDWSHLTRADRDSSRHVGTPRTDYVYVTVCKNALRLLDPRRDPVAVEAH